jgi:hypothetical protein
MYEFCIGIFIGYMGGLVLRERRVRSVGTQASEAWAQPAASQPISIQNLKRKFVPGELKNFWGKDS